MAEDDFVAWALDPARTVEERYTVELLVEHGVRSYDAFHKIHAYSTLDDTMALHRECKLNPAYTPGYHEIELRKTAWSIPRTTVWSHHGSDRPVRNLAPLRFFPALESVTLTFDAPDDVSPLTDLPALRRFDLSYPSADRYNMHCTDYTPLAGCAGLRELTLGFGARWPNLRGLETLTALETLRLSGNLLAMPPGAVFPRVRRAGAFGGEYWVHLMITLKARGRSQRPRRSSWRSSSGIGATSGNTSRCSATRRNIWNGCTRWNSRSNRVRPSTRRSSRPPNGRRPPSRRGGTTTRPTRRMTTTMTARAARRSRPSRTRRRRSWTTNIRWPTNTA